MSNARELAQIPSTPSGRRNLIINGAMNVAQRGTTHTSASGYTLDRFNTFNSSGSGVWTVTQSTDVPSGSGFSNSFKIDVTTADTSNTAFEEAGIAQPIEAQDLQQLAYNTSSAKELTLSFWVKSNKTGNYVVWFYTPDSTDQFSESYTINTANTWEKKTISIPAKTSGGPINNDNGAGLYVQFMLLSGPSYKSGTMPSNWESIVNANRYVDQDVNIFDSTSNEFYLTGVQLEVGTVATEFEHRSFGEELALCQRYYCKSFRYETVPSNNSPLYNTDTVSGTISAYIANGGYIASTIPFPVQMRRRPDLVFYSTSLDAGAAGKWQSYTYTSGWTDLTGMGLDVVSHNGFRLSVSGTWSQGQDVLYYGGFTAEAEL